MRVCASGQVYCPQNLDVFGKLNDPCLFERCRIQASYSAPSLGSWENSTLLAHLIELLLDDPDGVLDDLGQLCTSTEFTTCWTCLFTTCSPVRCWIVS